MRKKIIPFLTYSVVSLLCFSGGFFVDRLLRVQVGQELTKTISTSESAPGENFLKPGTYYVKMQGFAKPTQVVAIRSSATSDDVGAICIDNCLNPQHVYFQYSLRDDVFGVALAELQTGPVERVHLWTDVGLKGRIFVKNEANEDRHAVPQTLLDGKWIQGYRVVDGILEYQGKRYRFDPDSGEWKQIDIARDGQREPGSRTGNAVAKAGGTPAE